MIELLRLPIVPDPQIVQILLCCGAIEVLRWIGTLDPC